MKSLVKSIASICIGSIALLSTSSADDLLKDRRNSERVVNLKGSWRFTIGDDPNWSSEGFDHSNWTKVRVPNEWEDEGYRDYNGYAWYRRTFKVPTEEEKSQLFVAVGRIDDVDEVFINGQLVGSSGQFPPNYSTAYDQPRTYLIPEGIINYGKRNTIAVRIYDGIGPGGIVGGKIGIYQTHLPQMKVALSGTWQFHPGDNMDWKNKDADTSNFYSIKVPMTWERAGHEELDGFAWYRKSFEFEKSDKSQSMVLLMGKIDDMDEVYLNGKLVGGMGDLENTDSNEQGQYYNKIRNYYFSSDLLDSGTNVISVRVYDEWQRGGIYEGPVGIMTQGNYIKYWEKRRKDRGISIDW